MKFSNAVTVFNGWSIWVRIVLIIAAVVAVVAIGVRAEGALKYMIFGDTEAKREHGNTVVAQQQTKAEGRIADATIQTVHERDVYHDQVVKVVHEGQERVNAADHGQQMDPAIDAAVADGLCRVHDSLCRRAPGSAPLQPVR